MNVKLMKTLLRQSQSQLRGLMSKYLKERYEKVIVTDNYILAEGNIPICLVAHLDTVFEMPPSVICYDKTNGIMWSPYGLGTDDRAGVYMIMQIINKGLRPHIIFTTDEERGALGANALIKDYPKCPFENVKAIIELDRKGKKDSVYYSCINEDFEEYINSYGFTTAKGSFTDIVFIAPEWGIAAVNLSCGYMHEHSIAEYLMEDWMDENIERICEILNDAEIMPFFEYIEHQYNFRCFCCNKETETAYNLGNGLFMCPTCYNNVNSNK